MANLTLRQPVLLYEAVEAVYAYINNIIMMKRKTTYCSNMGRNIPTMKTQAD